MVQGAVPNKHPYLFFSKAKRAALRERTTHRPYQAKRRKLISNADQFVRKGVQDISVQDSSVSDVRSTLGKVGTTAMAYVLTDKARYGRFALNQVESMLKAGPWTSPSSPSQAIGPSGVGLQTAEASLAAALAYDWCHDLLSDRERQQLATQIMKQSVEPYRQALNNKRSWWLNNPVSNWCGVLHGGCGLAALAIANEKPKAKQAAIQARKHVRAFLNSVTLKDGGGHEGIMYWRYGVRFGLYFYFASSRLTGDHKLFEHYAQRMTGYWDSYMLGPDGVYANFNDMKEGTFKLGASEGGPSAPLAALMDHLTPGGDRLLRWAADHGGSVFYWQGASPFWLIWRSESQQVEHKPTLQSAVLFRGAGHAIFQSSHLWLAFNGGWTSDKSHYNLDLGSFVLVAGNQRLIHEAGYGDKQTGEHSTLLIGGKGQHKDAQARYLDFTQTDAARYLICDLSDAYGDNVKKAIRQVAMIDGRYVVLIDQVKTREPTKVEARLQTHESVHVNSQADHGIIGGDRVRLHVLAAGADLTMSQGSSAQNYLSLRTPAKQSTTVLTLLFPTDANQSAPKMELTHTPLRLKITRPNGEVDTLHFAHHRGNLWLNAVNDKPLPPPSKPDKRILKRVK